MFHFILIKIKNHLLHIKDYQTNQKEYLKQYQLKNIIKEDKFKKLLLNLEKELVKTVDQ
jgi:hypothetical protein